MPYLSITIRNFFIAVSLATLPIRSRMARTAGFATRSTPRSPRPPGRCVQMAGMLAAQAASNSVYVQSQGYTRPGMGVPRDYTTTHGMHDHSKEEREWATTNRMVPGPPRRSLIGTSDRP